MFERILVPLDGSALAAAAIPYAALIPSQEVRLLRVEPVAAMLTRVRAAGTREGVQAERIVAARSEMAAPAEVLRRQGRQVELLVAFGDPGERIVAEAAETDLIVMVTRGRGSGRRALYGSVADHVARTAPVPVLLVHGTEAVSPPPARILVPLDSSAGAEAALPLAANLGGLLDLPLHLVEVVEPRVGVDSPGDLEGQAATYLAERSEELAAPDLHVTTEVGSGPAVGTLLGMIRPTDLVVMASRGQGRVRRWLLGSMAERLVHRAPAPVLLVR